MQLVVQRWGGGGSSGGGSGGGGGTNRACILYNDAGTVLTCFISTNPGLSGSTKDSICTSSAGGYGTPADTCPTTDVLGCCTQAAPADIEICNYPSEGLDAGSWQVGCASGKPPGTWSISP